MKHINSANRCSCSYSQPDSIDTDHRDSCAMVVAAIEPNHDALEWAL